jgi:hypothetical protein
MQLYPCVHPNAPRKVSLPLLVDNGARRENRMFESPNWQIDASNDPLAYNIVCENQLM